MKKGIDISKWQGEIDFAKVAQEVDFIILREGYRQSADPEFFEYVRGCRKNNILIHGVYHFIYALNNQDVIAEAKSCIANFKAANLDKSTVRIWCDLEYDTINNAKKQGVVLGKNEVNLFTQTFCDYLASQGYLTGIYTNCDYYKNYYDTAILSKYPVWLADYTGEADYPCMMQQYSNKGVIAGISGRVDMNYCYCADHQELEALILDPQKVVDIALAEIGYLEKASSAYLDDKYRNAGNKNYTKYGRDMHALYPSVMDYPAAWCDAFVDWCFYKAYGISNAKKLLCGNFDDYTVASAQLYKNEGAWYKTPEVGDQVFFTNASGGICHTGLVVKVNKSKRICWTVEGNTSSAAGVVANGGCVRKKSYEFDYVRVAGFGRPRYGQVSGYVAPEFTDGSSMTLISNAQIHLNNFVNAGLAVDGQAGDKTYRALRAALQSALNFDRAAGLKVDGVIGPKTKAALKNVLLCKGSSGHLVTVLEIGLLLHGIDPRGVECPGIFGDGCRDAVGRFQAQQGLHTDYIAGYHTFKALILFE